MTVTSSDITAQVQQIAEGCEGEYNVTAVVESLIDSFDLTGDAPTHTLAEVEDAIWILLIQHRSPGTPSPAELRVIAQFGRIMSWARHVVTSSNGPFVPRVTALTSQQDLDLFEVGHGWDSTDISMFVADLVNGAPRS